MASDRTDTRSWPTSEIFKLNAAAQVFGLEYAYSRVGPSNKRNLHVDVGNVTDMSPEKFDPESIGAKCRAKASLDVNRVASRTTPDLPDLPATSPRFSRSQLLAVGGWLIWLLAAAVFAFGVSLGLAVLTKAWLGAGPNAKNTSDQDASLAEGLLSRQIVAIREELRSVRLDFKDFASKEEKRWQVFLDERRDQHRDMMEMMKAHKQSLRVVSSRVEAPSSNGGLARGVWKSFFAGAESTDKDRRNATPAGDGNP